MKIAGGMFGLEEDTEVVQANSPQFLLGPNLLFLSARCGLKFLVDHLKPAQVWLPSYLCCSILESIDPKKTDLCFFEVGYDLEVVSLEWMDNLIPGSLVVLIDYFGFPCDDEICSKAQSRGAYVLEDASQALLSKHTGRQSDYLLFSPRKTVGVPDGGVLRFLNGHNPPDIHLNDPPANWWLKSLEASIGRREFDLNGGERKWYDLFREVERDYPMGFYRMSDLSKTLLESSIDYETVSEKRRMNFAMLAESFGRISVIKELDQQTVPLGFPIRVHNREAIRQHLFKHNIYPPIHWDIIDCVPGRFSGSHRLSAEILTIPCDQRLEPDDILRIIKILHEGLGVHGA